MGWAEDRARLLNPTIEQEQRAPLSGPCIAVWGREKGYIAIRDPFTGEVHEIPYHDATEVWKSDVQAAQRRRAG